MDKKSTVLFQLSKDDHSVFFNVTCLDETSSAVQVEKPTSGCDINTIARDTILEFFYALERVLLLVLQMDTVLSEACLHLRNVVLIPT